MGGVDCADGAGLETIHQLSDINRIENGTDVEVDLLGRVNQHWGWTGLKGIEIVGNNEFGNLMVLGEDQAYWRICPEELTCEIVARSKSDYFQLVESEDFQVNWNMTRLAQVAREHLGGLKKGRVYYLVIPAILGGPYDPANIRSVPLEELIELSGDLALAIKNLPDGARIKLVPDGARIKLHVKN